ncbi:MAG: PEP-CTERM sorting domain-containing protein [Verrucomicrobiaceae bacterium]|nr:MAG: PEP-CTERM sorting domain-containing protein [Verrucomicrobiaceae bacterium]
MKTLATPLWLVSLLSAAFISQAHAQTDLYTLDLSNVLTGSWSSTPDNALTLDFGNGLGTGSITFTGINNGFFAPGSITYTGEPYQTTLLNGDILHRDHETVFSLRATEAAHPGLQGFQMTVALDEGMFPAGSVFLIRSLDSRPDGNIQRIELVSGLEAPTGDILPSDFGGATGTLVEISPGMYASDIPGVSRGAVMPVSASGKSFTVNLLADSSYGGGIAFAIATAVVPEPSVGLLAGIAGLGLVLRRRR